MLLPPPMSASFRPGSSGVRVSFDRFPKRFEPPEYHLESIKRLKKTMMRVQCVAATTDVGLRSPWVRVWGLGFGVWGLGFRV